MAFYIDRKTKWKDKFVTTMLSRAHTPFQLRASALLLETLFSRTRIRVALLIAVHLWTVFVAFNLKGWKAAVITLNTPLFAELYWLIDLAIEGNRWFFYHVLALVLTAVIFKLSDRIGGVQINISREVLDYWQ